MVEGSILPKPGDIIAGKYRVERTIGKGGMSVVFGAVHRVTDKRFAIKWLQPEPGASVADAAQRFIFEAQVAGRLQHPNVVEVYDVGEVSGSFYMVMEWLEGESLAARLERTGPLSFDEARALLIPCMRGVDEAHAAGVVHRDLKPANIFVCQATKHAGERTKVLDFGIAKLANPGDVHGLVTDAGVLVGTPYYLSPEQLRAKPVDHRTDIYAFGVMFYELLSGMVPFQANNFAELILQITTGEPKPLRELTTGLPSGAEALIARAMANEPDDRFPNLAALIAALEGLNSSRARLFSPFHASFSSSQSQPQPVRPARRLAPYLVTLLAVGFVVALWAFLYVDRASVDATRASEAKPDRVAERVASPASPISPPTVVASEPSAATTALEAAPAPTPEPTVSPAPGRIPSAGPSGVKQVEHPRPRRTESPSELPPSPPTADKPSSPDHNPLHMRIQ